MIAKYLQSETVADLFNVKCFCSVYAWILIKCKLHFDFLVVFTPLLRPVNSSTTYHDYCIIGACISFFCTNEC